MAEIHAVTMPKLGLAMTEGTVVCWHKAQGDAIRAGEELADIETTKITNAYESPVSGVLRRQVVATGQEVPVGALIAVVAPDSVSDSQVDAFVADAQATFTQALATGEGEREPEPERVETAAGPLRVLATGDPQAPPLLLLHGFGGDLGNWMFLQPLLAERFRAIAVDLPGHGGSTKQVGEGGPAALAEAVLALMDALEIERAHLVGHSLGGALAVETARLAPARVRSLTAISPAGLGGEINMDFVSGFLEAKRAKQMRSVLGLLFAEPDLVGPDMIEAVLRYKRLDGVAEALRQIAGQWFAGGRQAVDLRAALAGAALPRLLIWGAEDRIVPPDHGAGLPAEVEVAHLPAAGHMAHMEQPAEVHRLIADLAAA